MSNNNTANEAGIIKDSDASKKYEASFSISYDAKDSSFSEHRMDAKALAESILGVEAIVNATVKTMTKSNEKVSIMVDAPIKQGSVIIDFILLSQSVPVMQALEYIGIAALPATAGFATLLETVKAVKNKNVSHIEIDNNTDTATLHIEGDEDPIVCNAVIGQLAVDPTVREGLYKVIQKPLLGKTKAQVNILDSANNLVETIDESTIPDFVPLPKKTLEHVDITTETIVAKFSQVNFFKTSGWAIKNHNDEEYTVKMKDTNFLNAASANQQAFKSDDLFEMEIRVETVTRPKKTTTTREVLRVSKHFVTENKLV